VGNQTGRAKNNILGKIRYLWNCCRFFRQIYSIYRREFKPHILWISLQKLMWFNRYNSLNFKIHFYKWTTCINYEIVNCRALMNFTFLFFATTNLGHLSCDVLFPWRRSFRRFSLNQIIFIVDLGHEKRDVYLLHGIKRLISYGQI